MAKKDKAIMRKKISLAPLKYEDAVSAFLKVKPEPKKKKEKRGAKTVA